MYYFTRSPTENTNWPTIGHPTPLFWWISPKWTTEVNDRSERPHSSETGVPSISLVFPRRLNSISHTLFPIHPLDPHKRCIQAASPNHESFDTLPNDQSSRVFELESPFLHSIEIPCRFRPADSVYIFILEAFKSTKIPAQNCWWPYIKTIADRWWHWEICQSASSTSGTNTTSRSIRHDTNDLFHPPQSILHHCKVSNLIVLHLCHPASSATHLCIDSCAPLSVRSNKRVPFTFRSIVYRIPKSCRGVVAGAVA